MNILIVGYGNIGKHIHEEFKALQPYIKDPFQPQAERYPCKNCTACELGCSVQEKEAERGYFYDFAFICVPTDCLPDGSCDTSIVEQVVSETNAGVIVIKSTVPPGTTERMIAKTGKKIVFSPEHYGVTQHCKSDPGFVILGGEKDLTAKVAELYGKVKNGYYQIRFTDTTTAELLKYMLNSFLALKVTFCNEFADLAKKFGVCYPELRELFVLDERVGASHTYVYPDKPYYDSHCFNKDVPALVQFADGSAPLLTAMNELNLARKSGLASVAIEPVLEPKNTCQEPQAIAVPVRTMQDKQKRLVLEYGGFRKSPEEIAKERAEKLQAIANTQFQYDCSICLIIRDENEYLEEWLRWHIGQGVQHFYIYDHGSKQPVQQFVQDLGAEIADKVTVIDWSGPHENAQPDAYNDCLKRFGSESKWIGFIDADEHVRLKNGQTLPEFLENYTEFAGVMAIWIEYGAGGQRLKSKAPLRERFKKVSSVQSDVGKVFVQPSLMKDMYIHNGHPVEGFDVVSEWKETIEEFKLGYPDPTTNLICIDHYYTKSYEEWIEKLKRGRCHARYIRRYGDFFRHNPEMEYCRENLEIEQQYEISQKAVI